MAGRTSWKVARHQPLRELAPGLWTLEAELDGPPIGRRMIVVALADGRLVLHSAVCADEPTMAALARLGEIGFVIVPNGFHRLDAAAYKHRFPHALILATPVATRRVAAKVAVDGGLGRLPADPALGWELLRGAPAEAVFLHRGPGGVTAIFNDALFNLPDRLPGLAGKVVGLLGSTGGPKVTRIARRFLVRDPVALAEQFRALAALPDLVRAVPGHGAILEGAAAAAGLERAADGLSAR
ncbi:MAG: hypothetical protein R2939_10300 [Kofleriaceae bacterium]